MWERRGHGKGRACGKRDEVNTGSENCACESDEAKVGSTTSDTGGSQE